MESAEFLSKNSIYSGDFEGILRSANNEFVHGLHYHDFYEFVIYLGDAGIFRIDEGEYLVRRGDLVLIDMFKPHVLIRSEHSVYQRFSISVDLNLAISFSTQDSNLLDIFHNHNHSPVYHVEEDELQKYVSTINQYQQLNLSKGRDILSKALVHQLMAYAYSDCFREHLISTQETQYMEIVSNLISYIDSHLGEEITLAALAEEVSYSEYYVCRLFKKITGKTLTGYIQEKRIESAAFLLRTYDSANQVAEQVGFNNYSYFYKTFKRYLGCSPAEYQAKFRK